MHTNIYLLSDFHITSKDGSRSFSGIANSGKPFLHHGKLTIVDFDNIQFHDNVPVLLEHDRSKRIGFGKLSIESNQLTINGNLLDNDMGKQVALDADGGFPFQMSAHVSPGQIVQLTGNDTAVVNGQSVSAPISILKNCRILEVSFTPTGVDSNTHATVFSDNPNHPNPTNKEQSMKQSDPDKLNASIKVLEAANAEKDKQIADLTAENKQLKADKAKADVSAQLSQAGFKQDDKGNWQGIDTKTVDVLLSLDGEQAKTMIAALQPPKANAPDYFFSEQFGSQDKTNASHQQTSALLKVIGDGKA